MYYYIISLCEHLVSNKLFIIFKFQTGSPLPFDIWKLTKHEVGYVCIYFQRRWGLSICSRPGWWIDGHICTAWYLNDHRDDWIILLKYCFILANVAARPYPRPNHTQCIIWRGDVVGLFPLAKQAGSLIKTLRIHLECCVNV